MIVVTESAAEVKHSLYYETKDLRKRKTSERTERSKLIFQ